MSQEHEQRHEERERSRAERDRAREERHQARQERRRMRRELGVELGFDFDPLGRTHDHDDLGQEFSETVEKRFAVGGMPRVHVRNVSGDTRVHAGASGEVVMTARKYVRGVSGDRAKRLLENVELELEQHGDDVTIAPRFFDQDRGWLSLFRGRQVAVDFDIAVPVEVTLDVHTVSGELSLEGTRGPAQLQAVSGEVVVADVQGPLRLKTVSGDASCTRYVGSCIANSVSGDLAISSARLRSSDVHSVSGDVTIDGELGAEGRGHRVKTISGDVALGVGTSSVELLFRTNSGDLHNSTGGRVVEETRKHKIVVIGGGAARVEVKTVSGDLVLRDPRGVTPERSTARGADDEVEAESGHETFDRAGSQGDDVEATTPMPESRSSDREVLERLARGEIGVEDAAAALDAARGPDRLGR